MVSLVRARLTPTVVALWCASVLAIQLAGNLVAPLPNLAGASPAVALVAPSFAAAAITAVVRAPLLDWEVLSRRRISLRAHLVGLTVLSTTAAILLAGISWHPEATISAVRNLAAYTGLGLILGSMLGGAASAVPVLAALALGIVVTPASSPLLSWAVRLSDEPVLWTGPLLLLAGGALLSLTRPASTTLY